MAPPPPKFLPKLPMVSPLVLPPLMLLAPLSFMLLLLLLLVLLSLLLPLLVVLMLRVPCRCSFNGELLGVGLGALVGKRLLLPVSGLRL